MVILRTRNKITYFLMILAWASPFNRKIQLVPRQFLFRLMAFSGYVPAYKDQKSNNSIFRFQIAYNSKYI